MTWDNRSIIYYQQISLKLTAIFKKTWKHHVNWYLSVLYMLYVFCFFLLLYMLYYIHLFKDAHQAKGVLMNNFPFSCRLNLFDFDKSIKRFRKKVQVIWWRLCNMFESPILSCIVNIKIHHYQAGKKKYKSRNTLRVFIK